MLAHRARSLGNNEVGKGGRVKRGWGRVDGVRRWADGMGHVRSGARRVAAGVRSGTEDRLTNAATLNVDRDKCEMERVRAICGGDAWCRSQTMVRRGINIAPPGEGRIAVGVVGCLIARETSEERPISGIAPERSAPCISSSSDLPRDGSAHERLTMRGCLFNPK